MNSLAPEHTPSGTRRVSKAPLAIAFSVVIILMIIIGYTFSSQGSKKEEKTQTPAFRSEGTALSSAQEIIGNNVAGTTVPEQESSSLPPLPSGVTLVQPPAVEPTLSTPPLPPLPPPKEDPLKARSEALKLAALDSTTQIPLGTLSNSRNAAVGEAFETPEQRLLSVQARLNDLQRRDPTKAYLARLKQIKDGIGGGTPPLASQQAENSVLAAKNIFSEGATREGDFRLTERVVKGTPNEVLTGSVIPAFLLTGINSEIPGRIIGQVAQNVYDSATGDHLLIPAGSRLFGLYDSNVIFGQSRVLISWQRLVFPNGSTLNIGEFAGVDAQGASGLSDQVDNHYLRLFGSSFLLSGIIAGVAFSQDNSTSSGENRRAGDVLSESVGQQLGNTAAQVIQKNLAIAPTLEIRPGFRFNVLVSKDMVLPSYKGDFQ